MRMRPQFSTDQRQPESVASAECQEAKHLANEGPMARAQCLRPLDVLIFPGLAFRSIHLSRYGYPPVSKRLVSHVCSSILDTKARVMRFSVLTTRSSILGRLHSTNEGQRAPRDASFLNAKRPYQANERLSFRLRGGSLACWDAPLR
jgi:hypothetical protein